MGVADYDYRGWSAATRERGEYVVETGQKRFEDIPMPLTMRLVKMVSPAA